MPFAENVFVSTTSSVDHADIAQYHGVVEVLRDRFGPGRPEKPA